MARKNTKDEFIEKALKLYGDKYDYSKVNYVNNHTKVCIICPEHGEFWQTPNSHLNGRGCKKCGVLKRSVNRSNSKTIFIDKAKEVHGDKYDYSKVDYINNHTKVCIICPEHGEFWQKPLNHVYSKQGCPKCSVKSAHDKQRLTTEEFIECAKKVHGDRYDYSKVEYVDAHTKVCIICPKHGEFWQTPNAHSNGRGCPVCKTSRIEKQVLNTLVNKNIQFIYQANNKIFKWLEKQSIDFYLPDYNIAIECQGKQHFNIGDFGSSNFDFNDLYKRDKLKYELCKKNNIKLLYYTDKEYANITSIFDIYNNNVFYTIDSLIGFVVSSQ